MNCYACPRTTLSLFIRSFTPLEASLTPPLRTAHPTRFFSNAHTLRAANSTTQIPKPAAKSSTEPPKPFSTNKPTPADGAAADPSSAAAAADGETKQKPAWLIQKEVMKQKLNGEAWNPRKKLSPDTMEGIRHLHATQPEKFTTPILAQHFKVSAEAIRRILKSKWKPSDEEQDERLRRWDKRGETIWSNLVELGVKPPKKWREMGVGKAQRGEVPRWKSKHRRLVPINESVEGMESVSEEPIIPIAESEQATSSRRGGGSLWERM